jgi:hypothetical protein
VGLLYLASIAINAVGAFSRQASAWNGFPRNVDLDPGRLWSWRRPQFLAPFVEPEGAFLPLPVEGLVMGSPEADRYRGSGWGDGEGAFRWTDGPGASAIRFSLPDGRTGAVEIELRPYLGAGKLTAQRLVVAMNDRDLASFTLTSPEFATYRVPVPADVTRPHDVLWLRHPDAASPAMVEGTSDGRQLGVAVRTIRWVDTEPSLVP